MHDKINQALDEIRPALRADGGDVDLIGFDSETGVVTVRLTGMCNRCPMAGITLKNGVESILKKKFKEVTKVVAE